MITLVNQTLDQYSYGRVVLLDCSESDFVSRHVGYTQVNVFCRFFSNEGFSLCRYETEFFMNVIHGRGIISWAAVDTSRSDSHCDELIGFVTARVITASECDVSPRT